MTSRNHNLTDILTGKMIPPDFINPQGVKWWQLDENSYNYEHGIPYLVDSPEHGKEYVIVENNTTNKNNKTSKTNSVVYVTDSLEALYVKLDQFAVVYAFKNNYGTGLNDDDNDDDNDEN